MIDIGITPSRKADKKSVLIAILGPYPMTVDGITTEQRLIDMAEATEDYEVNLVYVPDWIKDEPKENATYMDEDRFKRHSSEIGMGRMRNWGVNQTVEYGYDYLFMVENDAWVNPDTLSRLLKCPAGIIIPHMRYPSFLPMSRSCWGPQADGRATGYSPLSWCIFSAMLFNAKIFSLITPFFNDYDAEGPEYLRWRGKAIIPLMDLDTTIDILRCPSGHSNWDKVPMNDHYITNGAFRTEDICPFPMLEIGGNLMVSVWVCSNVKDCDHYVILQLTSQRDSELEAVHA